MDPEAKTQMALLGAMTNRLYQAKMVVEGVVYPGVVFKKPTIFELIQLNKTAGSISHGAAYALAMADYIRKNPATTAGAAYNFTKRSRRDYA